MKTKSRLTLIAGMVAVCGMAQATYVTICDPGNTADTTGYGDVAYTYKISATEVSSADFTDSGAGNGNEGTGSTPAVNVNLYEAMKYCNYLTSGNTNNGAYVFNGSGVYQSTDRASAITIYGTIYALPTEDEWYKAAYYTGNSAYSLYADGTSDSNNPPTEGGGATGWNYHYVTGVARDVTLGTTEQNETVNMMGNAWEWLEDIAGGQGVLRGGGYTAFNTETILRSSYRHAYDPSRENANTVGFRPVKIGTGFKEDTTDSWATSAKWTDGIPEAGSYATILKNAKATLASSPSIERLQVVDTATLKINEGCTLNVSGNAAFKSGSTFSVGIGSGASCGKIIVTGTGNKLDISGATLEIDTIDGDGRTIAISDEEIIGTFDSISDGGQVPDQPNYFVHYNIEDPSDGRYHITCDTTSGITPTSSGIDLRAYQAADGVYVEFMAYNVEEVGEIELSLLGADGTVWTGTTNVVAGERSLCRFLVPGLEMGSTYSFKLRDEVGKIWSASSIPVGKFAVEMTQMSLAGMTLSFSSLPDREYEIQWTEHLGNDWQTVTNVPSQGELTSVVVMHPAPQATSGFYKIILK